MWQLFWERLSWVMALSGVSGVAIWSWFEAHTAKRLERIAHQQRTCALNALKIANDQADQMARLAESDFNVSRLRDEVARLRAEQAAQDPEDAETKVYRRESKPGLTPF